MDPVVLRTSRLELRCVSIDDVDAITAACQDPLIARYTQLPTPYRTADARWFIGDATARWRAGTEFSFGFYLPATGELAGVCSLKGTPIEVGYWTAPGFRGQGLTVEAVERLCQWGFDELRLDRIGWCAIVGNQGSRAVAVRVGFEVEGTRRETGRNGADRELWVGTLHSRPELTLK